MKGKKKRKPGNLGKKDQTGSKTVRKHGTSKRSTQKNTGPDDLALTKSEILEFCDRVLKKWQNDPVKNARNIPAMLAVRTSVFFSDEVSLAAIWTEIISWIYSLLYQNAQAQARKEGQQWAEVFSKISSSD